MSEARERLVKIDIAIAGPRPVPGLVSAQNSKNATDPTIESILDSLDADARSICSLAAVVADRVG